MMLEYKNETIVAYMYASLKQLKYFSRQGKDSMKLATGQQTWCFHAVHTHSNGQVNELILAIHKDLSNETIQDRQWSN